MTRMLRALLVVYSLSAAIAFAESATVRGELHDVPTQGNQFTVQLSSVDRTLSPQSVFVIGNGSFQFQSVPTGTYTLEVRSMQGEVLKQQMINVTGPGAELSISLGAPGRPAALPQGGSTVSLSRLRHDPNGRASREYALGEEYLLKNDLANARKHLEKALKADPEYPEAHVEMGTTAFRLGQVDEARHEFERAVELDPTQTIATGNLASLLFQTKSYDEAEAVAHRGLETSPHDPKLHFIAGASGFAKGHYNGDTATHLEEASKGYPNAHLLLAETLLRLGQAKNVLMHLQASLVSTNAEVRARAQDLITKLGK